ncbi:MAG: RNA polymerase sigma factor [Verrucomicrobiota bacterium]
MTNNGKQQEWMRWIREKGPRFLLFARQQTRSEADAQDVFQEALLKLWKRRAGESEAIAQNEVCDTLPPDAQVFVALRQCAIDHARKEDRRMQRETQHLESQAEAWSAWFDADPDQVEQQSELRDHVRSLESKYQEVLTLKIWGDLTYAQIAKVLDIPANTAASRYRYGLESLRRKMRTSFA